MTPWMDYLFNQQPEPTNATGVQVTLTVFDPNNNTYSIGTTTSDINGKYAFDWTPSVSGLYKITATFAGSNAYYSSSAETAITVQKAATATPTNTPLSLSSTQADIMYVGIAIIVVIIVIGAVLAILMLRKKA